MPGGGLGECLAGLPCQTAGPQRADGHGDMGQAFCLVDAVQHGIRELQEARNEPADVLLEGDQDGGVVESVRASPREPGHQMDGAALGQAHLPAFLEKDERAVVGVGFDAMLGCEDARFPEQCQFAEVLLKFLIHGDNTLRFLDTRGDPSILEMTFANNPRQLTFGPLIPHPLDQRNNPNHPEVELEFNLF